MSRIIGTLRGRIVLAAALSTAVVLLGVGGLVLAGARRDAQTDLDRRLQNRAAQIAKLPSVRTATPNGTDPLRDGSLPNIDFGVRVVLRGKVIAADGVGPEMNQTRVPAGPGIRMAHADARSPRYRAATVQVVGRPRMLVEVSAPLSSVDGTVRSLRRRILLVGLIGLLVAIGLATLAANYAVRALGRLRTAADEVSATEQLALRIPEDGPAEVHAVSHALNAMLARLERSAAERERALLSTKQFAADAGHELRTPLAVLQTGLETLARNPDLPASARQEIVDETLAEHRRLSALVEALQALTRGDGGAMGDERAVDLAEVVESAATALRRDHPTASLTTDIEPRTPAIVASPTGVRLLIDNLLQNAARYGTGADGTATIRVTARPSTSAAADPVGSSQRRPAVDLAVEDDGPGIAPSDGARITERFVRGTTAKGDGSGLGLAIAAQQARALGGDLAIGQSASGGARFATTLTSLAAPTAPTAPAAPAAPASTTPPA